MLEKQHASTSMTSTIYAYQICFSLPQRLASKAGLSSATSMILLVAYCSTQCITLTSSFSTTSVRLCARSWASWCSVAGSNVLI